MAKENENKKGSSKTAISAILLIAILVGLFYAAPRMQSLMSDWKSANQEKEKTEPAPVEVQEVIKPQAPDDLKDWIPLVEKQLPVSDDNKFRLLHIRLSEDTSKLLLDLELSGNKKKEVERFDLILERDEFGRYISDNDEIPMKLYPPVSPPEEEVTPEK